MSPVGDALDVPAVPVERLSQHDPDGLERTLEAFEAPVCSRCLNHANYVSTNPLTA